MAITVENNVFKLDSPIGWAFTYTHADCIGMYLVQVIWTALYEFTTTNHSTSRVLFVAVQNQLNYLQSASFLHDRQLIIQRLFMFPPLANNHKVSIRQSST